MESGHLSYNEVAYICKAVDVVVAAIGTNISSASTTTHTIVKQLWIKIPLSWPLRILFRRRYLETHIIQCIRKFGCYFQHIEETILKISHLLLSLTAALLFVLQDYHYGRGWSKSADVTLFLNIASTPNKIMWVQNRLRLSAFWGQ